MSEQALFELWKELHPSEAFKQGLAGYAGKFFIPTKEKKQEILEKIANLKKECKPKLERKFLKYLEQELSFEEPEKAPDKILWTIFAHLAKEGINKKHLAQLAENGIKLLNAYEELGYDWPLEIKILTNKACKGLLGIIKSLKNQLKDKELKAKFELLEQRTNAWLKNFFVSGLVKCDFSEIYPILKKSGGELDRRKSYPKLLKNLYDYYESPPEIERKALGWLSKDLPTLQKVARSLAKIYRVKPAIEEVASALARRGPSKKAIPKVIERLRAKLRKVIERELVKISKYHDTRVMESPPYLVPFIPSAAMSPYNTLTKRPFNIFFVTTDEKFSPPTGLADLFQVLVHEEYGHCVNFTNSGVEFVQPLSVLEKANTTFHYPISEGISFHRELESLQLLRKLIKKKDLSAEEREFLAELKKLEKLDLFLKEIEFVVYEWRIIRFLRAIGDVRINTRKQSIAEFIDWAHKRTGLSKKMIFNQIFIFQDSPGYAPCYSIAGMALSELQALAKLNKKSILEFNTLACSLGAPPRTIFEGKLRKFACK